MSALRLSRQERRRIETRLAAGKSLPREFLLDLHPEKLPEVAQMVAAAAAIWGALAEEDAQ